MYLETVSAVLWSIIIFLSLPLQKHSCKTRPRNHKDLSVEIISPSGRRSDLLLSLKDAVCRDSNTALQDEVDEFEMYVLKGIGSLCPGASALVRIMASTNRTYG